MIDIFTASKVNRSRMSENKDILTYHRLSNKGRKNVVLAVLKFQVFATTMIVDFVVITNLMPVWTPTFLGPAERANLSHWIVVLGAQIQFPKRCVFYNIRRWKKS
jgi:hypothetical protein